MIKRKYSWNLKYSYLINVFVLTQLITLPPVVRSSTATCGHDILEHAQIWIKQMLFWVDDGVWTA